MRSSRLPRLTGKFSPGYRMVSERSSNLARGESGHLDRRDRLAQRDQPRDVRRVDELHRGKIEHRVELTRRELILDQLQIIAESRLAAEADEQHGIGPVLHGHGAAAYRSVRRVPTVVRLT